MISKTPGMHVQKTGMEERHHLSGYSLHIDFTQLHRLRTCHCISLHNLHNSTLISLAAWKELNPTMVRLEGDDEAKIMATVRRANQESPETGVRACLAASAAATLHSAYWLFWLLHSFALVGLQCEGALCRSFLRH